MKIEKNKPFEVKKERSYTSCILQGLTSGMDQVGAVWKNQWPMVILTFLFSVPFRWVLTAGIAVQMGKWSEMGYVPRMAFRAQYPMVMKAFCRYLAYVGVCVVPLAVLFAVQFATLRGVVPVWALCVLALLVVVSLVPMEWVKMELLFGKKSVKQCLTAYKVGVRYMTRLFSFGLLLSLFAVFVMLLVSLPLVMTMIVWNQANIAESIGDAAYLPWHFWLMVFLSSLIFLFGQFFVMVLLSHAEYLLWGSISASESEKGSVEEIPAESETEC